MELVVEPEPGGRRGGPQLPIDSGVTVDQRTRAVGGEMRSAVDVPGGDGQLGIGVRGPRQSSRARGVTPLVVERVLPLGPRPGATHRVRQVTGGTRDRGFRVDHPVRVRLDGLPAGRARWAALPAAAAGQLRRYRRAPGAAPREDVDHARHGIAAVEYAHRAPDDLDPLDLVRAQVREIERAAGVVHRHAVDQDLDVIALAAPQEERRLRATGARPDDRRCRGRSQRVGHGADAPRLQLFPGPHGHRHGHRLTGQRDAGRGDHDPRQGERVRRDGVRLRPRGRPGGIRRSRLGHGVTRHREQGRNGEGQGQGDRREPRGQRVALIRPRISHEPGRAIGISGHVLPWFDCVRDPHGCFRGASRSRLRPRLLLASSGRPPRSGVTCGAPVSGPGPGWSATAMGQR